MLRIERLSKTYADGKRALADVDLEIRRGRDGVAGGGRLGVARPNALRLIAASSRRAPARSA